MATMQHKIFCVREFIKTESATAMQRAFRLRFNIQPPTRKNICRWNQQFTSHLSLVLILKCSFFYVSVSVHHKLIYIKNQRDATWQYVY